MKFYVVFAILSLTAIRFCDMCEISGEKCECKIDSIKTEMNCFEKSSFPKTLNLNEIVISENVTNIIVKIENKIYRGINKSSYGKFLVKIKELWIYNNQINKLESNTFQFLTSFTLLDLTSNGIEDI